MIPDTEQRGVIGVLGGMGPGATVDMLAKIVASTPAERDQDHIRVVVDRNPQVPSREDAFFGRGPSPGPALASMARGLERAGATVLVIASTSAHLWIVDVRAAVTARVVDMVDAALREASAIGGAQTVGLLAATQTVRSGLYAQAARSHGLRVIAPDESEQAELQTCFHAVKSLARASLCGNASRVWPSACTTLALGRSSQPARRHPSS